MVRSVVVGVDGSASSEEALEWAAADARRRGLGLRLVHVCEQSLLGPEVTDYCAETLEAARERVGRSAGDLQVTTELPTGSVIDAFVGESVTADCVVLGSRGLGGFKGLLIGSVSVGVAGHAACPVVIVRGSSGAQHGRVVVGDDGSRCAEVALAYAAEQARARGVPLQVTYAWQMAVTPSLPVAYCAMLEKSSEQELRMAAERLAAWREKYPDVEIVGEQVVGHPAEALIKAGQTADLAVVGTRGLGGFASAILGSVSRTVLHQATCPVAVVRPRPEQG
ncbi:universal stress protein [Nonomuraea sp. SBT364]|uniref:universal stress protein n=1 Tax=Nonomuraea sp. SBT364 TaxID=1580530 RepID=UPI00066AEA1B|nr:universal stress protein [Nonomuraea sp. SBT364]